MACPRGVDALLHDIVPVDTANGVPTLKAFASCLVTAIQLRAGVELPAACGTTWCVHRGHGAWGGLRLKYVLKGYYWDSYACCSFLYSFNV
jgi:hypothetical protein